LLGYSEKEVWHMTLRKLILLYEEYKKEHGMEAKNQIKTINGQQYKLSDKKPAWL
jgi:hypothetical protein